MPLLLGTVPDRVVLNTFTLDHDELVDLLTDERYPLTPTAAALLVGCDGSQRVGELTTEHADAYGVEPALLHEHLRRLVDRLPRVGLARVRRRWRTRALGMLLDLRPGTIDDTIARRRYPATARGCAPAALFTPDEWWRGAGCSSRPPWWPSSHGSHRASRWPSGCRRPRSPWRHWSR